MKLGIGKAVITPAMGTPLAGFAHRTHGCEGVLDDLEVRALWFQDGESAACIVTADLIGFGSHMTSYFRNLVQNKYGLPKDRLLLTVSHTHSGPQIEECLPHTGVMVPEVRDMVCKRVETAIEEAHSDLRTITMHAGKGLCEGFAINRRRKLNGKIEGMAPDPEGVRDDQVTVITCRSAEDDSIVAALFHFTCHASTMGDYNVTADYPGVARRQVEKLLGNGATAAVLPGCFGDVRSNCVLIGGRYFRSGVPMDITLFGEALGNEVVRVINEDSKPIVPQLSANLVTVDLPISKHPTREELETLVNTGTTFEKAWAEGILSEPFSLTRAFDIQRIDLAKEAILVALSGEVCVEYGHFIKSLRPDAYMLPLGYSNSLAGYIPTAAMYAEGGYEPEESCPYFNLPAPFAPELEQVIRTGILQVMKD